VSVLLHLAFLLEENKSSLKIEIILLFIVSKPSDFFSIGKISKGANYINSLARVKTLSLLRKWFQFIFEK